MPKKDTLLSRFFHSDSDEVEEEVEPRERTIQVKPSQFEPSCLILAADHPINELWRKRTGETDWLPSPSLRLAGPPGQEDILDPEETKKELSRLLFTVSSTANKRLIASADPSVSSNADAEVVVFLTAGDLTAWFLVYPPMGKGREVDRRMLERALKENGVSFGVDETVLDTLPQDPERYFHMHLIARGKAPIHGQDGYVEDMFSRDAKKTAKVNESGKVDYMELNLVQSVNAGDVICKIIEPTQGEPGSSVSGQPIPGRDGKKAQIPQGRGTMLSEDGSTLIATSAGRLEFSGHSFQVKPVLEINGNVDYSTGNVNFMGDVEISGDVCSGFHVKALGNITVRGVVEACKLEAGGNLTIEKGVKGDDQTTIQAHRSIYAKYLENCNVCAKELLQSDCIINSNVYSDGSVQVDSGRGVIIGGKVRAAHTIRAKTVGSRAECHTVIGLGGMPGEEFEHECLLRDIKQLESVLEILEHQPDSPAKLKGLPLVRAKLSADREKLRQYEENLEEMRLQERFEDHKGQYLSFDMLHPGTEVSIGGASTHVKSGVKYCKAVLVNGEIRMI